MRKLQVTYYDDQTEAVYMNRTFDASVDLQEALMKLAVEVTDKEDELHESDPEE